MESKKIKMIWDFRGPVASKTAEHHVIHLKEYITSEGLNNNLTGVSHINDMLSIAYMIVDESEMLKVRDALKPHRGEIYEV
jgi:hypothetical protein